MNEIKTIGIVGSGKMGSDLFYYLSDFKFNLRWHTRNEEQQGVLKKTFQKKIKRQLKHGLISQEYFDLKNNYQITTDLNNLSDCDLIIESVIEEQDIKKEVFRTLENIVKPACILASNSSSILPSEIAAELKTKNRIMGLHFFYPIAFKNVVEIVQSEFTDELSVEKTKLFLDEINRFYVLQNTKNAFLLNRFLLELQIKAYQLKQEYALSYEQIDRIAKQLIPEFGLFEMMDQVGHYTMYRAILNYSRMDENKSKYKSLLEEIQDRKLNGETHFFITPEEEAEKTDPKIQAKIIEELQKTANHYLNLYSEEFDLNIFHLKKGIEELCGLVL